MSESSFDVVKQVRWLLQSVVVVILLVIVVKIDEVGVVIIAKLPLVLRSCGLNARLVRNTEGEYLKEMKESLLIIKTT